MEKYSMQNIDQKVEAILAGIGIGHLPRQRVQKQLNSGELIPLDLGRRLCKRILLPGKISNKGKGCRR